MQYKDYSDIWGMCPCGCGKQAKSELVLWQIQNALLQKLEIKHGMTFAKFIDL